MNEEISKELKNAGQVAKALHTTGNGLDHYAAECIQTLIERITKQERMIERLTAAQSKETPESRMKGEICFRSVSE